MIKWTSGIDSFGSALKSPLMRKYLGTWKSLNFGVGGGFYGGDCYKERVLDALVLFGAINNMFLTHLDLIKSRFLRFLRWEVEPFLLYKQKWPLFGKVVKL